MVLQLLAVGATAVVEELAGVDVGENLLHARTTLGQCIGDELCGLLVQLQVRGTSGEAGIHIELRHNGLDLVNELTAPLVTEIIEQYMEHALGRGIEGAFLQETLGENTVLDRDTAVEVHEGEGTGDNVHTCMCLVRPLERGERATDLGHDVHGNMLGDANSRVGDTVGTGERILNHLNNRGVLARAHDETENAGQLLELGLGGHGLREVKVHLVTVKVGVIRLGGRDVQAECGSWQDLDAVALHRPLVERRLAIEEHVVSVNHVAVNHVALVEIDHVGVHILEGHHPLLFLEKHGLGTGVLHAVLDSSHEAVAVVGCHNLGLGEVRGNFLRDTQFIHIDVGIGGNHRAGGEVDTLAHEVTADTTGLGTETGLQGLQRTTRPLSSRGHALDIVVHVGRDIVLQQFSVLLDILTGLAGTDEFTELLVAPNDVDEDVGQIVVHPLIVLHDHGRADSEGRNRQDRAHHPGRVGELRVKSEDLDGVVGETLEATENHLGLEGDSSLLILACQLALESADGTLDLLDLLDHLGPAGGTRRGHGLGLLANVVNRPTADIGKTLHALELGVQVNVLGEPVLAGDVEGGAVHTDAVEGLDGEIQELVEVDGTGEGDVAEMALALKIRMFAGGTDLATLDNTEPGIKDATGNGVVPLMSLIGDDLDH